MPQLDPYRSEFSEVMENHHFMGPKGIPDSVLADPKKKNRFLAWFAKHWEAIPRPLRAVGNLCLCIALLAVLLTPWCVSLYYQLHPVEAFRLEERRLMVGPSQILETVELDGEYYDRVILARDGNHMVVYGYHSQNGDRKSMHLYTTDQPLTAFKLPSNSREPVLGAVVLLDETMEAGYAEFALELENTDQSDTDIWIYRVRAQRQDGGYYLFPIDCTQNDQTLPELWQCSRLQNFLNSNAGSRLPSERLYWATIRFYDTQGALLKETQIYLQ